MSLKTICLVEDEPQIQEILKNFLEKEGYKTMVFSDGEKASLFIKSSKENIDCFILDRMIPGKNGIEICQEIRKNSFFHLVPILMLTALSQPEEIVEGLDAGADDYMTKPFDINVLNAKIRTLMRRISNTHTIPSQLLNHKGISIDLDQCKVWVKNEPIELTLSEFKILCCLFHSPGKVFTRNQIVEFIQDGPVHVTDRTVDTHVFGLRKKLKDEASAIETIRGIGYRLIRND